MTTKERMDYLLARLPEEKKEEFMSEFRGAVSDEARSDVVKNTAQCMRRESWMTA